MNTGDIKALFKQTKQKCFELDKFVKMRGQLFDDFRLREAVEAITKEAIENIQVGQERKQTLVRHWNDA